MSDFLIEDGSFFRLRTLAVGYTLPKRLQKNLRMSRARIYASGTNLWTKQQYSGYTPEFPNNSAFRAGIDYLSYPMAKTLIMGINLDF